jgi:hypothetical protein
MMPKLTYILAFGVVVGSALVLVAPADALAQDAQALAEKQRLIEEMRKLAQRNAWGGVERNYELLVELKVPIEFDVHQLGAEAARTLGKTYQMYRRLERAVELDPQPELIETIKVMEKTYGRVRIEGNERWSVVLSRQAMPFAPDERKSIEYAMTVLAESGSFEGMLPGGDYVVGNKSFSVAPGTKWTEIVLEKSDIAGREGLIVYNGPVLVGGYAYSLSSAGDVVTDDTGVHMAAPSDLAGSGTAFEGGWEIGFTREFALAATLGYRGMYGSDTLHGVSGWLAAAIRPGDLRIAVGPTWGLVRASGTGVAEWFDVGQDPDLYRVDDLAWEGRAWAAGGQLSVGYGVLDLSDTLQGSVELAGSFSTDGGRPYMGFGLRIGIVPVVPRFQEDS